MKAIINRRNVIPFTQAPNHLINDEELTIKAKMIYIYMLSKPDNWIFNGKGTAKQLNVHEKTIQRGTKELIEKEWLTRTKLKTGYIEYNFTEKLYEKPKGQKVLKADNQPKEQKVIQTKSHSDKKHQHSNTILISNTIEKEKINNNNKGISINEKIKTILEDTQYMEIIKLQFKKELINKTKKEFKKRIILHGAENKTIEELKIYFTNILAKENRKKTEVKPKNNYKGNYKTKPYITLKSVGTGKERELTKEQYYNKKYHKSYTNKLIWQIIQN